jgi:hypothetical protein
LEVLTGKSYDSSTAHILQLCPFCYPPPISFVDLQLGHDRLAPVDHWLEQYNAIPARYVLRHSCVGLFVLLNLQPVSDYEMNFLFRVFIVHHQADSGGRGRL